MTLCSKRWFEKIVTHKDNVKIDFQKSCKKCRVYKTKACAEEILTLVLLTLDEV